MNISSKRETVTFYPKVNIEECSKKQSMLKRA